MAKAKVEEEQGIQNARGWMETIQDQVERVTNDDDKIRENAMQEIQEGPLSVEVRSGWYVPGNQHENGAEEYRILLTTGGPALRIIGDLGQYGTPENARLEWQDWFKPWTEHRLTTKQAEDLLTYACQFYFGE